MPIQDSDLFLIEDTSGVSKKIAASKLKSNLAANTYNNYKLLVNKPDYTSRFVYAQNMQQSVAPTDYMMIERSGVSYKVNGQQIIDYFPTVPAGAAGPITDVVNIPSKSSSIDPTPSPNIFTTPPPFDANYSTVLYIPGTQLIYEFDAPWDMAQVSKFRGGSHGANEIITLTFTDTNGRAQAATNTTAAAYAGSHSLSSIDFSVPIKRLAISIASSGGYFWAFYDSSENGVAYPAFRPGKSTLTLGSTTNLDLFTEGDAINMVDEDGNVASYTPVTSTISNVTSSLPDSITGQSGNTYSATEGGISYKLAPSNIGYNWTNAESASVVGTGFTGGSTGTGYTNYSDDEITITFSPSVPASFIGYVRCGGYSSGDTVTVQINDEPSQNFVTQGAYAGTPFTLQRSAPSPNINKIKITTTGVRIVNFYNSDQEVSLFDRTTLTFTSNNKDLKYFSDNDPVQEGQGLPAQIWSNYVNSSTLSQGVATNLFNGAGFGQGYQNNNGIVTRLKPTVVFNPPLAFPGGSIGFLAYGTNGPTNGELVINGTTYNVPINGGNTATWGDVGVPPGNLTSMGVGLTSVGWNGIRLNYTVMIDGQGTETNDVITTSVDIAGNSMRTSGGSWKGADGSGDADGDTVVTGPAKSGTANFEAVGYKVGSGDDSPFVTTTNSNTQWIDNNNRLNKEFFIKAASTRTGLAIMRTKAIAQAQAWVADAGYESNQLVKHNGRYWLALSSSTGNSPDTADLLTWFDLGAI